MRASSRSHAASPFRNRIAEAVPAAFTNSGTHNRSSVTDLTFAKTSGTQIVGPDGNALELRGINLGGWLEPEGYILHVPGYGSPSSIRTMIEDLLGPADTDQFYQLYTSNYITERDIALVAQWGFNSVRVPFHYALVYDPATQTFREPGFDLLRTLVGWCKKYGIYVILDMHCAPGGQNAGNISDSDSLVARLWTDGSNQDATVAIWTEIARRFAGEPSVLGYDLLNEPALPPGYSNATLLSLYQRLAAAMRTVDGNHILFVEGNHGATDATGLTPPFDSNMVYSFHKYWDPPTVDTIQAFLNLRTAANVPLWMGEFGENSNAWGYDVIRLAEQNGIGWCWWTLKKLDTITGPLSVPISAAYQKVLDFWNGTGARPSAGDAHDALFGMAADLSGNVVMRTDVVAMLSDRNAGTTPRPFRTLNIPGAIHVVDYDMGNEGVSYHDTISMQTQYNGAIWNSGWAYRNDGVDIEQSRDPQGSAYDVGWTEDGEWLSFTLNVGQTAAYHMQARVASAVSGGRLRLYLDGTPLGSDLNVPNTGGWQSWTTLAPATGLNLTAGQHVLKLLVVAGGFNINLLRFTIDAGDFNGDGIADMVLQFPDGSMGVWYLGGAGRQLPINGFAFLAGPSSGIRLFNVADLNGDGVPDLILQFTDGSMGVWYIGGPQRNTITGFSFISGPIPNWMPVSVADVNVDGQPDLIIQNKIDGSVGVWYLGGTGGNQIQGFAPIAGPIAGWKVVGSADLNSDGHPDLVIQYSDGSIGAWYLGGTGGSQIQGFAWIATPSTWSVVGVVDMDKDGYPDLVIRNTDGTLGVWYLGGAQGAAITGFTPITTPGLTNWRELGTH